MFRLILTAHVHLIREAVWITLAEGRAGAGARLFTVCTDRNVNQIRKPRQRFRYLSTTNSRFDADKPEPRVKQKEESRQAEEEVPDKEENKQYPNEDDHKSQKGRDWESKSYTSSNSGQQQQQEEQEDTKSEEDTYSRSAGPSSTALTPYQYFATAKSKNKDNFLLAVDMFIGRDRHRRGHVEFIYAALRHMKQFNVHRDLETYKKIFEVFPKGKFIPENWYQVEFMHFPKQQQCAVDLLEQMESYTVQPDSDLQRLIQVTFGNYTIPMRKMKRMAYWMPKFKHLSPWPLPEVMPDSAFELAKLAIARITSVDLQTKITCLNTMDMEDSIDHTWIVSGQAPLQRKLIEDLPADRPVYVEGAFRVWLQRTCVNYFILRAEPKLRPKNEKDDDDVGLLETIFSEKYTEKQLETVASVHEQEDGIILACCATGTSSRDSVMSWVKFLEESNPRLGKDIAVLFTLQSPIGPTDSLEVPSVTDGKPRPKPGEEIGGYLQEPPEAPSSPYGPDAPHRDFNRLGNLDDDWMESQQKKPSLEDMGMGPESETKFVNWPHYFSGAVPYPDERLGSGGQSIDERRKAFERLILKSDLTKDEEADKVKKKKSKDDAG